MTGSSRVAVIIAGGVVIGVGFAQLGLAAQHPRLAPSEATVRSVLAMLSIAFGAVALVRTSRRALADLLPGSSDETGPALPFA